MDSDLLILENIDSLFEKKIFTMAPDYPDMKHGNSGVMIITPSQKTFEGLKKTLEEIDISDNYYFGDQDIINTYFKTIITLDTCYNFMVRISDETKQYYDIEHNSLIEKYGTILFNRNTICPKIVHFIFQPKPFSVDKPFESDYYPLYMKYLRMVRKKKMEYLVAKKSLLIFILVHDLNTSTMDMIENTLKQTHKNKEFILLLEKKNCQFIDDLDSYMDHLKAKANIVTLNEYGDVKKYHYFADYVTFVDLDMIYRNDAFEKGIEKCIEYDLDFCQFSSAYSCKNSFYYYSSNEEIQKVFYEDEAQGLTELLCDKIYKGSILEGVDNFYQVLNKANSGGMIGEAYYNQPY